MAALRDLTDLDSCDREPIQFVGRVQGFGYLIAVSADWIVAHVSRNAAEILGGTAEEILGTPLSRWMPVDTIHDIRTRMQMMAGEPARLFGVDALGTGRLFDIGVHAAGPLSVIEMEAKRGRAEDRTSLVQSLIARISRRGGADALATEAARALKALTGFDRVMVYRFAPDWTGTVIAEAREPEQEPYMHLRYPATDIPRQARELYRLSPLRLIDDVDGVTVEVVPERTAEGLPLDLSLAIGRAVSPVHLEYLRNMGVAASMSASIMQGDRLWGLFACHHRAPRYVDYETRTAVELFAQLFSYELARKEQEAERAVDDRARALHDRLMAQISGGTGIEAAFDAIADQIGEVISHDGIVLWTENGMRSRGVALGRDEMAGLARFLNTAAASRVYATDSIARHYPGAEAFADRASGLLAVPVSRSPRDYLVLFRGEQRREVSWGGDPRRPAEISEDGLRVSPRKSFDAWSETVKDRSARWTDAELRAAESLRVTLLEVVLKLSDEAERFRARAQEQQDLLIAELNHRVRNILNLIRGLLNQSADHEGRIEDFVATLGGRIHALAQAHDQLTADNWGAVSLISLLRTEIDAFVSDAEDRLVIEGPDAFVEPQAFTALALVAHELVTNSAKYGALCDSSGTVRIGLSRTDSGDLSLSWTESGGPPVTAPSRRGFGTTIIERSVPYELGGTAELSYCVGGVEARFTIPARHVAETGRAEPGGGARPAPAAPMAADLSCVLLVEDNLIISLDATAFLEEMGARRVVTAPSVRQALKLIETEPVSLAVLDVNLGSETSAAVARALGEAGIPFVLATGYGADEIGNGSFPQAPVVKKPYGESSLRAAFEALA